MQQLGSEAKFGGRRPWAQQAAPNGVLVGTTMNVSEDGDEPPTASPSALRRAANHACQQGNAARSPNEPELSTHARRIVRKYAPAAICP